MQVNYIKYIQWHHKNLNIKKNLHHDSYKTYDKNSWDEWELLHKHYLQKKVEKRNRKRLKNLKLSQLDKMSKRKTNIAWKQNI